MCVNVWLSYQEHCSKAGVPPSSTGDSNDEFVAWWGPQADKDGDQQQLAADTAHLVSRMEHMLFLESTQTSQA